MSNTSLDLSGKIDPFTIDLFSTLTIVSERADVPFFVAGATARDMILDKAFGIRAGRMTQDVDLGIMVDEWAAFDRFKEALTATGHFVSDTKVAHRISYKNALPLDMIPFGGIESPPGSIAWPPNQAIRLNVLGFHDAWTHALTVRVSADLTVRVASLPAMALLKLIAWRERRYTSPRKDVEDLALILQNYGDAGNEERLYHDHSEWLEAEGFDLERAGARLLGHDMAKIMSDRAKEAVLDILEREVDPDKSDRLISDIAGSLPGRDYEKASVLVKCLRDGIRGDMDKGNV